MAKLTDKKLAALEAIAAAPGKSGAYWRDLGHSPITLSVLERDRLAEGKGGYFSTTGDSSPVVHSPRWAPSSF